MWWYSRSLWWMWGRLWHRWWMLFWSILFPPCILRSCTRMQRRVWIWYSWYVIGIHRMSLLFALSSTIRYTFFSQIFRFFRHFFCQQEKIIVTIQPKIQKMSRRLPKRYQSKNHVTCAGLFVYVDLHVHNTFW